MAFRCLSVSSPRFSSRATKAMRAPLAARRSAATSPIPEVAPVMTTVLPFMMEPPRGLLMSADDVEIAEEEADFVRRRVGCVRTVAGIRFDRFREVLADRAGRRFRGIRGTHHFAVLGNGVFA